MKNKNKVDKLIIMSIISEVLRYLGLSGIIMSTNLGDRLLFVFLTLGTVLLGELCKLYSENNNK